MATVYAPEVIEFFILVFDISVNNSMVIFLIILFNLALTPFFVLLWLIAITYLLKLEKAIRFSIIFIFIIFSILFEIVLFYFYFTNIELIGIFSGPFLLDWTLIFNIVIVLLLLIVLITGILFAWKNIKLDKPELKLKGKILLIAFITFTVGGMIDISIGGSSDLAILTNLISRIVLAIGSILFYIGYMLPNMIKKFFLTEN